MTLEMNRRRLILATGAMLALPTRLAWAASTHTIDMLNKHPEDKKKRMVFLPIIQVVQPGDTVLFKSVDKGHNSASVDGMIPETAEPWKGKISKDIEVTFEQPGFYGYKCTPHTAMGMYGLIVVEGPGKLDNLEAAQAVKHKGRGQKVWDQIWIEADEAGLLTETTG